MKLLVYSTKDFELAYLKAAIPTGFQVDFVKQTLSEKSALLANGYDAISIFTADDASASVIGELKKYQVRFIAVRAAGYDNVDIKAANEAEIHVANVPDYSPYAIAEHTIAMMLAMNRKLIRSNEQVHRQNFSLNKLIGFDMHKKRWVLLEPVRSGQWLPGY
jgi:D-lactate dehydrogenase